MTLREEIEFLSKNYKNTGNLRENVKHNIKIAQKLNKENVVKVWEEFYQFFKSVKLPDE